MPGIKLNQFTKEIELKGPESFIEKNFDKIEDLLIESFGVRKRMVSRKTEATQEQMLFGKMNESKEGRETKRHPLSDASQLLSQATSCMPEVTHELKAARPPLRKYIRKVGAPGHERTLVEVVQQKPKELTLASLKEKFGLSGTKTGGTLRDAGTFGNMNRAVNG